MPQPIRLSNATDVLDVVPMLLGFYPTESLCGLFITETPAGRSIGMTARLDLPETPADLAADTRHLGDLLRRFNGVALVAYSVDADHARTVLQHLCRVYGDDVIFTAILAGPHGWTTIDPQMPDAVHWTNPYPATSGAAAAAATAAGLRATGTRDDLRESIQAPDATTAAAFRYAWDQQRVTNQPDTTARAVLVADITTRIAALIRRPSATTISDAAYLTARIQFNEPRDTALLAVSPDTDHDHRRLWQRVASLTPDEHALPALALLAMTAWISRDGALANLAVERADTLPHGPGSNLLGIARDVLTYAIPPSAWADLRRGLS